MSIPIAFAFDFEKVITLPTARFVPGNFAKTSAAPLTGEVAFDEMQFDYIYHDGPLSSDRMAEVHNWRMSEVVVANTLPLSNLSFIVCRTTHEERTLRHAVGDMAGLKVIVEQKGSIFMRRGIFIDEIYWDSRLLNLRFHGPVVYPQNSYSVTIHCSDVGVAPRTGHYGLSPGSYRFPALPASEKAIWRIEIEGCVVYHAPIPSTSGLVS
jgi:ssDNA thymidine ADP-ribosyltransferase, DarT